MAINEIFDPGNQIAVTIASKLSGDPAVAGQIPGVCLGATDAVTGKVVIKTDGVFTLSVKGTTGSNSAVAVGDILYYTEGNTPKIDKTTSGVRFGYALETVVSGATTTIRVKVGY